MSSISICNQVKALTLLLALPLTLIMSGCEQQSSEIPVLGKIEANSSVISSEDIIPNSQNLPDNPSVTSDSDVIGKVSLPISCRNSLIVDAFQAQSSSVQVKGCGTVKAVLADDNEGSRHQRFIVQLDGTTPEHTVLIAHNIDLAPKILDLRTGDQVLFYGEYEYNHQGGIIHWTHHDPAARHQHGWLEHKGKRFG